MSSYYKQFAKRKDFLNVLRELQRRIAKQEQTTNPLDTLEFQNHLRANSDRLLIFSRVDNEINAAVADPSVKFYQLPLEPDGQHLRVWYRFIDYISGTVRDYSGFGNTGVVVGSPTKQIVGHAPYTGGLAFNGTDTNYIRIAHKHPDMSIDLSTGFGVSVWVKPISLDLHGDKPRVIACKIADSSTTKNRGWSLFVDPDGTVVFVVRLNGVNYVRRATNSIPVLDEWYHITAFFGRDPAGGTGIGEMNYGGFTESGFTAEGFSTIPAFVLTGLTIIPLHVNGLEYTHDKQTVNDRQPYFATLPHSGVDILLGGTDEPAASRWAGSISEFRYWYDKIYTHQEALAQYQNKYTISSNVTWVALTGLATTAYEGPKPIGVGESPPTPPAPVEGRSTTALSSTPNSTNVDPVGASLGGGGGVDPSIPNQFYDPFIYEEPYALATTGEVSPDLKWKLSVAPGTGGYVKTEDYTRPGYTTDESQRVMRLKSASGIHPLITSNTARFYDVHVRCLLRTVSRNTGGPYEHAFFIFKYVDTTNFYFVVLKTTAVELWKRVAGVDTMLAAQSNNPGGYELYPVGGEYQIDVRTLTDGTRIQVWVEGGASPDQPLIDWQATGYNPPDTLITSLGAVGVRATGADITIENFLARPILGDSFQVDAPYTLTTVGQKSPNQKWELQTVPDTSTGGTVRTYDHSTYEDGGRVLNLNSGSGFTANEGFLSDGFLSQGFLTEETTTTTAATVLATPTWNGLEVHARMGTLSQYVAGSKASRAQLIFKWKDPSNYYYIVLHPTGWQVKRKVAGSTTEQTLLDETTPTFPDNPSYPFHEVKVQISNVGRDVRIWLGDPLAVVYEEHSRKGGWYSDDGGVLAGLGRVGFKALRADTVYDNVSVRVI